MRQLCRFVYRSSGRNVSDLVLVVGDPFPMLLEQLLGGRVHRNERSDILAPSMQRSISENCRQAAYHVTNPVKRTFHDPAMLAIAQQTSISSSYDFKLNKQLKTLHSIIIKLLANI